MQFVWVQYYLKSPGRWWKSPIWHMEGNNLVRRPFPLMGLASCTMKHADTVQFPKDPHLRLWLLTRAKNVQTSSLYIYIYRHTYGMCMCMYTYIYMYTCVPRLLMKGTWHAALLLVPFFPFGDSRQAPISAISAWQFLLGGGPPFCKRYARFGGYRFCLRTPTVDSKKLQHRCRKIHGWHFVLPWFGLEGGHVPAFKGEFRFRALGIQDPLQAGTWIKRVEHDAEFYAIVWYTLLYYTVLYYIVFYHTNIGLYHITLCYIKVHSIIFDIGIVICYIILYYVVSCCIILYHCILYYIMLCYLL